MACKSKDETDFFIRDKTAKDNIALISVSRF